MSDSATHYIVDGIDRLDVATSPLLDLQQWSDLSEQIHEEPQQQETWQVAEQWTSIHQLVRAAMEYDLDIVDSKLVKYDNHIGTGANMAVFKGTHNGRVVALKRIRTLPSIDEPQGRTAALESLNMEIRIMSDVFLNGHDNIAKLQALTWESSAEDGLVPVLIMELAYEKCSTLHDFMQVIGEGEFDHKAWMISDLVCGLAAIHDESIVHGDLKPENVLLFVRRHEGRVFEKMPFVARISDFGYCEDLDATGAECPAGGTEYWNAPECMPGAPDDLRPFARRTQRDLFSAGLIMWYILSNKLPLGPCSGDEWDANRLQIRQDKIDGSVLAKFEDWYSRNLKQAFLDGAEEAIAEFKKDLDDELEFFQFAAKQTMAKLKADSAFATQICFDELLFREEGTVRYALFGHSALTNLLGLVAHDAPRFVEEVSWILASHGPRSHSQYASSPSSSITSICCGAQVQVRESFCRILSLLNVPTRIFINRKPTKIYNFWEWSFVERKHPGRREGWQTWAVSPSFHELTSSTLNSLDSISKHLCCYTQVSKSPSRYACSSTPRVGKGRRLGASVTLGHHHPHDDPSTRLWCPSRLEQSA